MRKREARSTLLVQQTRAGRARGRPTDLLPAVMPSTWSPLDPRARGRACEGTRWSVGCRAPATWRRMWRTLGMPAPAFNYHCEDCRQALRRHREAGAVHPDLLRCLALAGAILAVLVYVARH